MDEYFSNYIKELDETHKKILEELKTKREQLKELETEYYNFSNSRRESLSRHLYALKSEQNPDVKLIQKLEQELESLPAREQLESEMGKLKQEIEQLQNSFISKPFILPESTITPMINFKVDIDGLFLVRDDSGKYYVKEDLHGTALNNYKIEVDENGIPVKQVWTKQDSDTYGMPLKFERQLKITNPIFEIIKPVRKEVTKEIPEYKEVKISKFVPSISCPRCGWNLTELAKRVFCPNCSLSLYDSIKMQIENEMKFENDREKKNKKKWKLFK